MTATTFPDCADCQAAVLHEHPIDDPNCAACGCDLDAFGHDHGCGNDPEHDHCGPCTYGTCCECGALGPCDDPAACRAAKAAYGRLHAEHGRGDHAEMEPGCNECEAEYASGARCRVCGMDGCDDPAECRASARGEI